MPDIPLISFVDFVVASGTARLTRVRDIKRQMEEGYSPATDFYKGIREGIVDFHRDGHDFAFLQRIVDFAHHRKRGHYLEIVKGYRRFLGRKQSKSFDPSSWTWSYRDLTVLINPELGLKLETGSHVIKLYFKSPPLSQRRVDVALHLMERSLEHPRGRHVGIVDTRRGKLYSPKPMSSDLDALLTGEAAAFREMWRRL